MSLKERTINVDIMTKEYTKLKYKQGDSNQILKFKFYKNGSELDLTGYVVGIFYEKPNNEVLEKTGNISSNTVTTTITNGVLNTAGVVKTEIFLTKNDEVSISFTILIEVESSIDKNAAVQEKEEWDSIKDLLIKSNNLAMIDDSLTATNKTWSSSKISSQIKDIVRDVSLYGADPSLSDNTSIIQKCLDLKGHVRISKPGTYYVTQLTIGDDTTLEICRGAGLKQIDNTKKYVITNKDYENGNVNIKLIGRGFIDNNSAGGNLADGAYSDSNQYCGFGVHLENIRNLKVDGLSFLNSSKYALSICKSSNIRVYNIYFETNSDGVHFQPPIKNCVVDTVRGSTGDDTVSFTLGDYSLYRVSNEGNFEDVVVRNIESWCNEKNGQAAVKVTGSGKNNAYYFKNFKIENVYGNITGVNIQDDTYDTTSDDLKLTKVINFKLRNIISTDVLSDNRRMNIIITSTGGGDITIDDIEIPMNELYRRINLEKATLDKLTINNVTKQSGSNGFLIKNRTDWEWKSRIKQLFINNFKYSMPESGSFYALDLSYIECEEIYLNNVKFTGGDYIIGGGLIKITSENNTLTRLFVNNFLFDKCKRIFRFNTQTECYIQNGINTLSDDSCIAFIVGDEVNGDGNYCRVQANNVKGDMTLRALNPSTANVKLSINMNSGIYNNLTSRLTPQKFDKVICTTSYGREENKGYIIWDGEKWVKLV